MRESVPILGYLQSVGDAMPFLHGDDAAGQIIGAVVFFALAVVLFRFAQRKIE